MKSSFRLSVFLTALAIVYMGCGKTNAPQPVEQMVTSQDETKSLEPEASEPSSQTDPEEVSDSPPGVAESSEPAAEVPAAEPVAEGRAFVGTKTADLFPTPEFAAPERELAFGTMLTLQERVGTAVRVSLSSGESGWIRSCHLCTENELAERKRLGFIPESLACLKAGDDGMIKVSDDGIYVYAGSLPIRENQLVLIPGAAIWCNRSLHGRTFSAFRRQIRADSTSLHYVNAQRDLVNLPILPGPDGPADEELGGASPAKSVLDSDTTSAAVLPELPKMPDGIAWSETDKDDVAKAVKSFGKDPVSACVAFKGILARKTNPPTAVQKSWLNAAMVAARPRAITILQRDFAQAAKLFDLRGCLITKIVADKVDETILPDSAAILSTVKSKVMSGASLPSPVWHVTGAKGERLEGGYNDGDMTLNPKTGNAFLRITAQVKNVSTDSDPPYAVSVLGGLEKAIFSIMDEPGDEPNRLAMDDFICLVTPGGDWIFCAHVCEGKLRGMVLTATSPDGSGSMAFPGSRATQGEQFEIDVLFSVPKDIDGFRFLMFGAKPVPVAITN